VLRRLLEAIYNSPLDRLKRDVFTFYLLLDCDAADDGESEDAMDGAPGPSTAVVRHSANGGRAEGFARKRCIPRHWQSFMRGYWAVDHGKWEVRILSNLSRDLESQVLPPSGIYETDR
jgi:hypothetical protein